MRRVDAGGNRLARGEENTDGDGNAGLIIGSVLGTFALAAFLVVAYVSHEEDPVERPTLLVDDSRLAVRFCGLDHGLTPEGTREAIDAELRLRGYVSAGEWTDDVEMGVADGSQLDGGCGIIVAHARTGSHFRAVREDSVELQSCRNDVVAAATCGEDVEFLGTGVTSLRAYVMPGVSGAPDALAPTHRVLQAEAEHTLGRLRLVPGAKVYVDSIAAGGTMTISPPASGCVHYAVSAAGAGMLSSDSVFGDLALFARTLCENNAELVIHAGGSTPTTVAVRQFEASPGAGVATRVAAQISDAEIVSDIEDL
ncbi:MAG: hypothetical protein AB8H86_00150 [Polyangiales bacterium]